MYFLFEAFIFKNGLNTMDNISKYENRHLKQKEPRPSAATLRFKSLVRSRLTCTPNIKMSKTFKAKRTPAVSGYFGI
jgi:hypothetical protein